MRRVRGFMGLGRRRQVRILRATGALLRARLDLVVRPEEVVDVAVRSEDVPRSGASPGDATDEGSPGADGDAVGEAEREVAWSVRAAADHLPGEWTCLVRALASYRLLGRAGASPQLVLGARQPEADTTLDAHAWVEVGGVPVVGDHPDLGEYQVLERGAGEETPGTGT